MLVVRHAKVSTGRRYREPHSASLAALGSPMSLVYTVCEGVVARRAALRTELPVGYVMILFVESNMDSHGSIDPWLFYTYPLAMVCYSTHESAVSEIRLYCRSPSLSWPVVFIGLQSGSIRVL